MCWVVGLLCQSCEVGPGYLFDIGVLFDEGSL